VRRHWLLSNFKTTTSTGWLDESGLTQLISGTPLVKQRDISTFRLSGYYLSAKSGRVQYIALVASTNQILKGLIMSVPNEHSVASQEKLVSDMKAVITDAEEILHATADQAGEKIAGLRTRIQERLHAARVRLADAEAVLVAKTRAAAQATDAYVHENPWKSVGVAAGVGFLVGFILGRR
jgi:ElaB/YqjD/DUF883 family membrane-anchored ribosome-binding protein